MLLRRCTKGLNGYYNDMYHSGKCNVAMVRLVSSRRGREHGSDYVFFVRGPAGALGERRHQNYRLQRLETEALHAPASMYQRLKGYCNDIVVGVTVVRYTVGQLP